jgi:hypothetical protein
MGLPANAMSMSRREVMCVCFPEVQKVCDQQRDLLAQIDGVPRFGCLVT